MSRRRVTGVITGVVGVLVAVALGPPAAQAHPCATTWTLGSSTFLSANDAATAWAGSLPTMSLDEDCATIEQSSQFAGLAASDAAADPVEDAVSSFTYTPNMT